MGKKVKSIVKVAAIATAAYFGGSAIAGSFGGASTAKFGSTAFWKGSQTLGMKFGSAVAKVGTSLFSPTALQMGGLGLQTASYLTQRKAMSAQASALKQQSELQRQAQLATERFQQVQAKRQRLDIIRQQRIATGQLEATTGSSSLGLTGTSGLTGATSSIQSQATANLGAINAAEGASSAIGALNQQAADAGTQYYTAKGQQQQWASLETFGQDLLTKAPQIISIFS